MTYAEAIESLIESCKIFSEAVDKLQAENTFLTDTIEKYNLGEYVNERRTLLAELERCKKDSDIAINKADKLRKEYELKLDELNARLADIKAKQADINSYMDIEADKKLPISKLKGGDEMNIKDILESKEYEFLQSDPHLGNNICYLTLAGSRSYGTNNEDSDTDIRGFAIERPSEIFGNDTFEQIEERNTDTVIYALKKYINLCRSCNPNVIEMLGTREEDILYMNDIGRIIRDNAKIFLSRRAYATFAGYATMQLRRLENALAHDSYNDREKEHHILKSI